MLAKNYFPLYILLTKIEISNRIRKIGRNLPDHIESGGGIIIETKNVPLIRPLLIRQTIVAFITVKGGNKYRQVNQTDFMGGPV